MRLIRAAVWLSVPFLATMAAAQLPGPERPFDASVVLSSVSGGESWTSVGDFDGDGSPDAFGWFWVNQGSYDKVQLRTHINDGQGRLNPSWRQGVDVTGGQSTSWDTATGRLDRSKGDDFAAAFDRDVHTWVSTRILVSGQWLHNPTAYRSWRESFAVHDIELVDLDGDSLDEMVLIGAEIRVYRNTGGGFVLLDQYPLSGTELHLAELDGRPGQDFLVPKDGSVEILTWGESALQAVTTVTHGVPPSASPMHTVGDIDNDGDTDVVIFEPAGQYTVIRRDAGAWKVEAPRAGGPATSLADIDGDGDLDGVCCGGGGPGPAYNYSPSRFHVSINDGGLFRAAFTVRGLGAFRLAGAVDVNMDGNTDLIAGRAVWFNRGVPYEVEPQPDMPGPLPKLIRPCDWDRDGDPDVVIDPTRVYVNDGSGRFTDKVMALPLAPAGATFSSEHYRGDFDGDGAEDFIVAVNDAQGFVEMRLLRNSGGGQCVDGGPAAAPGVTFRVDPALTFGELYLAVDVDGNGTLDIVQGDLSYTQRVGVWWNDGNGFFTLGPTYLFGVPMLAFDADADGDVDLMTHRDLMLGDGAGNFVPGTLRTVGSGFVDPRNNTLALGDVDGDGRPDVGWLSNTGEMRVAFNEGGGTFTQVRLRTLWTSTHRVGMQFLDVDRDGNQDVLAWPGYWGDGGGIMVLFGDGNRGFPRVASQLADIGTPLLDVDGDGDLDGIGPSGVMRGVDRVLPRDGYRRQYGNATASAGRTEATLGATGPFVAGAPTELIVSGAPGNAAIVLAIGAAPGPIPEWPFPGMTAHVTQILTWFTSVAGGNPGEPGTGLWRLNVPMPQSVSGVTSHLQVWTWDPVSGAFGHTNGLELRWK